MTPNCLIFGADGQMGKACFAALAARNFPTVGLSKAACDITDAAALEAAFAAQHPAFVINTAALTNVDGCETERTQADAVNTVAPGLIAQSCARHGATMIHLSTDYVFGDAGDAPPHNELAHPAPINYYGQSKLAGELAIREALDRHIIVRTSWVFSSGTQNFLKTMMGLSDKLDAIRVVSDEASCPTAASDLADAIIAALDRSMGPSPLYGTWHACGNEGLSRLDFAAAIMAARVQAGARAAKLEPISQAQFGAPARRPKDSRMSCDAFTRDFGLSIPSFRASLDSCVHAMLSATKENTV